MYILYKVAKYWRTACLAVVVMVGEGKGYRRMYITSDIGTGRPSLRRRHRQEFGCSAWSGQRCKIGNQFARQKIIRRSEFGRTVNAFRVVDVRGVKKTSAENVLGTANSDGTPTNRFFRWRYNMRRRRQQVAGVPVQLRVARRRRRRRHGVLSPSPRHAVISSRCTAMIRPP